MPLPLQHDKGGRTTFNWISPYCWWEPPHTRIMTYNLYEKLYNFQLIQTVASRCAPFPDVGLVTLEGGLEIMKIGFSPEQI